MSDSDEWIDDKTGSDEPEANGDNDFRPEGATFDPSEIDDTTEVTDEISLGLNEAEARALDDLFSGTGATPDVFSDRTPPDFGEPIGTELPADTVPLLNATGNTPADFDALYKALR